MLPGSGLGNRPKTKPIRFDDICFTLHTTPQTTNFQNQSKLDCIIISAKPLFKPRFHPTPRATASGRRVCSFNMTTLQVDY